MEVIPVKTIKLAFATLLLIMCVPLAGIGQTAASPVPTVTVISQCNTTITSAGSYSLITGGLQCTTNGINIAASDVTLYLDGNGMFTPFITGCCTGILVSSPSGGTLQNVRILGYGYLQQFTNGISLVGVRNSQITGVFVSYASNDCLSISSDANGDPSQNDIITANNFSYCGSVDIVGNTINDSQLTGNVCNGGPFAGLAIGIEILSGNGNTLAGNNCGSLAVGIQLGGSGSSGATGNIVTGNSSLFGTTGILVASGANGNTFKANVAYKNTTLDIDDENASCGTDTWERTAFGTANQTCIH